MEWGGAAAGARAGGAEGAAESARRDTVIVFDWDDTILPTSWLEEAAAAAGGLERPAVQHVLAALCSAAGETLRLAETLGKVIFITNSAPGWVDQSCQHFMPQLLQQMRGYDIYARPTSVPIDFKVCAFQRECKSYRNVISVGDGDAERAASLRLKAAIERKVAFGGNGQSSRLIKSVKLLDFPAGQHLIDQHAMLQAELAEVVTANSSLDLRVCCSGAGGPRSPRARGRERRAGAGCRLVAFAAPRPPAAMRPSASCGALPPLSRGSSRADTDVALGRLAGPPHTAAAGEVAAVEASWIPSVVADAEGGSAVRVVRSAQGGPAVDATAAPGICNMQAAGRARGRSFAQALAKKQPLAALPPGLGGTQRPPGGAACREQRQPLPAASRAF
ncbi:unnamed protein product [Prorocentrum cordatum]|uniref:Uncharacterized protein n=1 Tax=Prorocentrum cordatum TaxID=2364126 RepID=A0ABN9THT8_9DINO|nr:unnamed protein product [Polarella glacialis]